MKPPPLQNNHAQDTAVRTQPAVRPHSRTFVSKGAANSTCCDSHRFWGCTSQKTNMTRENHPWIKMYLLWKMVIFHFSEGKNGKSNVFSINTNTSSFILYFFPCLIHRNKRVTLIPNLNFWREFLLYQWSKENSFTKISSRGNVLKILKLNDQDIFLYLSLPFGVNSLYAGTRSRK